MFVKKMTDEMERKKIAEEHWEWLESLLHKTYVDAFVHGYKHGVIKMIETLKEDKK